MTAFDVELGDMPLLWPTVVAFGGGLNNTALLVRWVVDGNAPPHGIRFADTGGERPEVYEHVARFSEWLKSNGMPSISITRKGGRPETLEQSCLRLGVLPSLAYGGKSCSHKFKIEPQERDDNRWPLARAAWKQGDKVVKLIGYGAEEQKRLARAKLEDEKYWYRFPLVEWGLDREGCERTIKHVGLPVPGKSSCFFCPAHTKEEIRALRETHPDLLTRALAIEAAAQSAGKLKTSRGLGRRFAWRDFIEGLPTDEAENPACMYCVDQ